MQKLLLAFSVSIVLAACALQEPKRPVDPADGRPTTSFTVTDNLPEGTFADSGSGYNGDLFVRGYAEERTVDEPFCVENCQTFRYVSFHILETGNDSLRDFLEQNEGNAYADTSSVGLGCATDDGTIRYFNHSDAFDMRESELGAADTTAILASTEEAPVTLKLTKMPLSGGSEAPACYSHFAKIEISG